MASKGLCNVTSRTKARKFVTEAGRTWRRKDLAKEESRRAVGLHCKSKKKTFLQHGQKVSVLILDPHQTQRT